MPIPPHELCSYYSVHTSTERASKMGASGRHMQHDTPSSFFTPPPSLPVTAASHAVPILLYNPTQYLILGLGWVGSTEQTTTTTVAGGVRKWSFFLSLRWGRQRASRETSYVPRAEGQSGRRRDSEEKVCATQKRPARSQGGRPRRPWACSRPASLFCLRVRMLSHPCRRFGSWHRLSRATPPLPLPFPSQWPLSLKAKVFC